MQILELLSAVDNLCYRVPVTPVLPTPLRGHRIDRQWSVMHSKRGFTVEDNDQNIHILTALLVEDNAMIAMDIEDILHEHGIRNVRLATTLEDADHHLTETIDVAVLDFSLGEGTTEPFAVRIKDLGIPFIFVSGFAEKVGLAKRLKDIPIVAKPFQPNDLIAAVNTVLARRSKKANGTIGGHSG